MCSENGMCDNAFEPIEGLYQEAIRFSPESSTTEIMDLMIETIVVTYETLFVSSLMIFKWINERRERGMGDIVDKMVSERLAIQNGPEIDVTGLTEEIYDFLNSNNGNN